MSVTPSGNFQIGSISIAVIGDSWGEQAKFSEIEILNANTTVIQTAGRKSERRTIVVLVSGSDIATLKGYVNTEKTLTTDQGSQGTYYIADIKGARKQDVSSTDETCELRFELVKQ